MDYPLLKDIKYNGELIHLWQFVDVKSSARQPDQRLYYKVDEDGNGFDFYSVMWACCSADHDKDMWNLESVEVECGIHGNARFDGIRHLFWGDDQTNNYGYHYYAHIPDEIAVLQALRELEVKYCRDYK